MPGHERPESVTQQLTLNFLARRDGEGPPLRIALWRGECGKVTGKNTDVLQPSSPLDFSDLGLSGLHDALEAMGGRWGAVLRKRFGPANTAKLAARAFGVSPQTTEGWLAGHPPHIKHLMRAVTAVGEGAVAYVLSPGGKWQREASVAATLINIEAPTLPTSAMRPATWCCSGRRGDGDQRSAVR